MPIEVPNGDDSAFLTLTRDGSRTGHVVLEVSVPDLGHYVALGSFSTRDLEMALGVIHADLTTTPAPKTNREWGRLRDLLRGRRFV